MFLAVFDHLVYVLLLDTFEHVLKRGHASAGQRGLRLVPIPDRRIQQLFRLFRQLGQHRGQVDGQLSEQVQGDRADVLQLLRPGGVLSQIPGFRRFDVRVGAVRQFHDQPHRPVEITVLVGRRNVAADAGGVGEQAAVVRISRRQTEVLHETRGPAGQIDHFADQVRVHLGNKLVQVQIQVVQPGAEFRGVVVPQVSRIQVFQVRFGADERPLALGHLFAAHRQEPMDVDLGGQAESGHLQHAGPEQGVEIRDVLADEVVDFRLLAPPPSVILLAVAITPLLGRGDVSDRRVEPDVPVVAGTVGDLEAEVWRRPRDIPVLERFAQEMALQIVRHLGLQVPAALGPFVQEAVQLFQLDEQMLGLSDLRLRARQDADRIEQLDGTVRRSALAAVARLVRSSTPGTRAAHKAIGQERAGLRIVQLRHILLGDQIRLAQRPPDLFAETAVFRAVRAAVIVERDVKAGEVPFVGTLHLGDQLLFATAFLASADHDRRAVRIVRTDVHAAAAPQLLKPDPNIGLNVLDQMPQMNGTVGVGQRRCHQNPSLGHDRSVDVSQEHVNP